MSQWESRSPAGESLTIWLLAGSLMKTFPDASTASPAGMVRLELSRAGQVHLASTSPAGDSLTMEEPKVESPT